MVAKMPDFEEMNKAVHTAMLSYDNRCKMCSLEHVEDSGEFTDIMISDILYTPVSYTHLTLPTNREV